MKCGKVMVNQAITWCHVCDTVSSFHWWFFLHLFCLPRLASAFIHSVPTLQVTLTDTLDFPLFRSLSLNDCSTNRLISISCIKSILCFNEMVLSFRFVLTSTSTSTLHHGWKYAQIICELLQFKIAECSLADHKVFSTIFKPHETPAGNSSMP